jgi:transcription-repair coupling factor (superfamily II helicase)
MALRPRFLTAFPSLSAQAWEISRLFHEESLERLSVLVTDNAAALSLRDDLAILHPALDVRFLPALETDLLRNRGPSLFRRVERIRFFCGSAGLGPAEGPVLFLVPVEALAQSCPKPSFWKELSIRVTVGDELSRTELVGKLAELGYLPQELVEREGQFAARGSIVDVFSPLLEFPLRIELFEDRVQSLRLFHPDSQRRLGEADSAVFPPCREFVFEDENLRTRLKAEIEDGDWDREDRDAFLDRVKQKSFFPSIDYWAPLLSPALSESRGPGAFLSFDALLEPQSLEGELKRSLAQMERQLLSAATDGEWVPASRSFLAAAGAAEAALALALKQARVWIGSRESTGLPDEPPSEPSRSRSHERLAQRLSRDRAEAGPEPLRELAQEVRARHTEQTTTVLVAPTVSQLERLQFLLSNYSLSFRIAASIDDVLQERPTLAGLVGSLSDGFVDPARRVSFLLDEQILGSKRKKSSSRAQKSFSSDLSLLDLKPGDHVVHKEHGIGRYLGLKVIDFDGIPAELLEIEYKEGSKLLVPVTRLNTIQKHSSAGAELALDKLGGQTWEGKKTKARAELQNLAGELLHLYSQRELSRGPEIRPSEEQIDRFAATFPFTETPDQEKAIELTVNDLRGPRPMDRLVCGDVGYGKTEVALRAAHAAVSAGYQVAVLVPTTILAAQHESTFRKRLAPLGYNVASFSRFKSTKEIKEGIALLKEGKVHVAVGTHKLLGSDFAFPNLGLLVIDEEQKFGVAHKEKLKKLRANVHVLSMTATPIPRTLNMSMSGLKDISIMSTAPADRLSVRTHVSRKKASLIQEAVEFELKRGGQVFYVHNRVQTIVRELEELEKLLPGVRIDQVHGQMKEDVIEKKMIDFYEGRTQLLLSTSIIESGLDVPNANTLIVDRADAFGLAQLYQMRGRVGRSNQRAYAYFLIPERGNVTADAEERLSVLEAYQELGSGFHIATHDLEIRGAGDFLGRSQSGQITLLGYDAYVELLQECIAEIRGEPQESIPDPEIKLGIDTTIPVEYIPDTGLRLMFYRRLASAENEEEVSSIEAEISDRFGTPPGSLRNLFAVMRVKCQLKRLRVRALSAGKAAFSVVFDPKTPVNPSKLVESIKRYPSHFQMSPDGKLLLKRPHQDLSQASDIMRSIEGALSLLESWCG